MSDDKQWAGLTIEDELPVGVYYAGTRHKRFRLRIPMAGDLIAAQEAHPQAPIQLITLAVYHRQLLALGDIPSEALTLELLRESLAEADLTTLAKADADLEKKLVTPNGASGNGGVSNTPSSRPAIGSMKSDA